MFKVRALFWLSTERWKRTSIAKSREWRKSRGAGVYGQSGVASSSPVLVFVKWENDGWGPEDYGKQLIGCSKWEGKTLVGYKESMAFLTLILAAMWGDAENGWWEVIPSKSGTVGDMLATVGYMGEDGRCARSNGARNAKEHHDWGSQLVWVEAVSHIFETHIGNESNQTCWSLTVGWGAEERTGYLPLMTFCLSHWRDAGAICKDGARGKNLHTAGSEFEMLSPRNPSGNAKGRLDVRTPLVWRWERSCWGDWFQPPLLVSLIMSCASSNWLLPSEDMNSTSSLFISPLRLQECQPMLLLRTE